MIYFWLNIAFNALCCSVMAYQRYTFKATWKSSAPTLINLATSGSYSAAILNVTKPQSITKPSLQAYQINFQPSERVNHGVIAKARWITQGYSKPNTEDCGNEYVMFKAEEHTTNRTLIKKVCPKDSPADRHFFISTSPIEVHLQFSSGRVKRGISLLFTFFEQGNYSSDSPYNNELFCCYDNRCIWQGLKCDDHYNCADLTDETLCTKWDRSHRLPRISIDLIIGVTISLAIIVLLTCIVMLSLRLRQLRRQQSNPIHPAPQTSSPSCVPSISITYQSFLFQNENDETNYPCSASGTIRSTASTTADSEKTYQCENLQYEPPPPYESCVRVLDLNTLRFNTL